MLPRYDLVKKELLKLDGIFMPSMDVKRVIPQVYNDVLARMQEFIKIEDSDISNDDLFIFLSGNYLVEVYFGQFDVSIVGGRTISEINRRMAWLSIDYYDFIVGADEAWIRSLLRMAAEEQ